MGEKIANLLPRSGKGTGAQRQGEGRGKDAGDLLAFAREARAETREAERRPWSCKRDRRLGGHKFRRQRVMGRARPDFVCLAVNLMVEVDGSQHVERSEADARRTKQLNARGFRVLRVRNNDVMRDLDSSLEAILAAGAAPHPGAAGACPSPAAREKVR